MIQLFNFLPSVKSLLVYSVLVFLIFKVFQWILARPGLHALNYYIKYGLYHIYVVLVTGCALIPCLFRPGSSDNIIFATLFYHLFQIPWVFGFKIETNGKQNIENVQKPVVFMCNHQSSLDMLAVVKDAPRRTAVIAKRELEKVPVFGFVTWLCGTIFIDRKAHNETVNIMKDVASKVKKNKTNVWVFPEGTRQQIDGIAEFKKGAFHLAVQAQIPIVPVVIGNCRNIIDIPNKFFNSGVMRVRVLPPIPTEGLTKDDVSELTTKCHNIMSKAYSQITEDHKEEYANILPLPDKKKVK